MRRPARAGAVAVVLASSVAALAGCGGSSQGTSTGGAAPAASGTPASAQTANSNKAAKFSQCMRANGVPDFPDPNANGTISLRVTPGSDLDPSSSAFKAALAKCKSLEPPGFLNGPGNSTANQNKLLQFVACMRKDGVPNMPDPSSNGALAISSKSGVDPQSPTFQAAMQKCRSLLPNGGSGAAAG